MSCKVPLLGTGLHFYERPLTYRMVFQFFGETLFLPYRHNRQTVGGDCGQSEKKIILSRSNLREQRKSKK